MRFRNLIKERNFGANHSRNNCKSIAGKGITGVFLQGYQVFEDIKYYRTKYGISYLPVESEAGGVADPYFEFLKQQDT